MRGVRSLPPQAKNPRYGPDILSLINDEFYGFSFSDHVLCY